MNNPTENAGSLAHLVCDNCKHPTPDKGRAFDGRRAYRCPRCGNIWTWGLQGREPRYSPQRHGYQFSNTGAYHHS